jgi:hypothetical protein
MIQFIRSFELFHDFPKLKLPSYVATKNQTKTYCFEVKVRKTHGSKHQQKPYHHFVDLLNYLLVTLKGSNI